MLKFNWNNRFFIRCALFSALFLTVSLSALWYHIVSYHGQMDERVAARQMALVESQQLYIHSTLQSVVKDVVFLLDMVYEYRIYDHLHHPSHAKSAQLVEFENMLISFVKRKGIYDKARYLDADGVERIRINYNNGKPSVVPVSELQEKSGRYYLQETLQLGKDDIFISPLDLNFENGAMEVPVKPMLRVAIPVFDAKGERTGAIVLNYLATNLFQGLRALLFKGESLCEKFSGVDAGYLLTNLDGHYLVNSFAPEKEFSFMYPDKKPHFIEKDYPALASVIDDVGVQQVRSDQGIFTMVSLGSQSGKNPYCLGDFHVRSGPNTSWRLVLYLPYSNENYLSELWHGYSALVVFMIFASVTSGYISAQYLQNKKLADYHIYRLAHTDTLTNLDNRMSFEKKVAMALSLEPAGYMVYLDVDDFKQINDRYGHSTGDAVLQHVANALKASFPQHAILGRLGGDEFVAYVKGTESLGQIRGQIGQLLENITHPVNVDDTKISVASSIGVVRVADCNIPLAELIKYADATMYAAKRSGKCRFQINELNVR